MERQPNHDIYSYTSAELTGRADELAKLLTLIDDDRVTKVVEGRLEVLAKEIYFRSGGLDNEY